MTTISLSPVSCYSTRPSPDHLAELDRAWVFHSRLSPQQIIPQEVHPQEAISQEVISLEAIPWEAIPREVIPHPT